MEIYLFLSLLTLAYLLLVSDEGLLSMVRNGIEVLVAEMQFPAGHLILVRINHENN
jgi:hypothetical protein